MYHNPNEKLAKWYRTRLYQEVHRDALDHGDGGFSVFDSCGNVLLTGKVESVGMLGESPATA